MTETKAKEARLSARGLSVVYGDRHVLRGVDLDLEAGEVLATGAYTSTYASVCFNGFEPLRTYCV